MTDLDSNRVQRRVQVYSSFSAEGSSSRREHLQREVFDISSHRYTARVSVISMFLCFSALFGCEETTPSTDSSQVERAGESAGESAGVNIDESAGESAGVNIDESAGESAGVNTDESAGESAGVSAGESAGELTSDPCLMIEERCDGTFDPPPPMNEHTGVYADAEQVLVIFGGNTSVPENCGFPAYTGESTTWLYYARPLADACGPWVKLEMGPPGRARHSADYGEGEVWVFGGRVRTGSSGSYTLFNDIWSFDVAARTWSEISATGPTPAPRYNSSLTFDSTRRALWVFGGNVASNALNPDATHDLWRFDLETRVWTELEVPNYIRDRMWHNAIYDSARDRLVFFGGADESAFFDNALYYNDFVFYNIESDSWGQADVEGAPDGRFWSQLVYQSTADTYMIFGGHDNLALGNRNDSWSFDPNSGIWTQLMNEDIYNKPANGFCDFPPDFTVVDRALPERRNAHSFSWSPLCDRGLMFGGKTDCGAINDVWRYSTGSGWESGELATEGESCHRWRSNPDNCVNMCF